MGLIEKLHEINEQSADSLNQSLASVVDQLGNMDVDNLDTVDESLARIAQHLADIAGMDGTTVQDMIGQADAIAAVNAQLNDIMAGLDAVRGKIDGLSAATARAGDQFNRIYVLVSAIKRLNPITMDVTVGVNVSDELSRKFAGDAGFIRAIADQLNRLEARK